MCGRYVLARATGDLASAYDADVPAGVEARQSWNIAPTTTVPLIRDTDGSEGHRELNTARWGLLPNGIASGWEVYEVVQAVGNVKNNDVILVEPLESETLF